MICTLSTSGRLKIFPTIIRGDGLAACRHTAVRALLLANQWEIWMYLRLLALMFSFYLFILHVFFPSITAVLSNKCGFQLQYQMIFCVWLLAFSPQLCEQLRRYNVVPALSDILQESVKEKVTRIILAAFRVRAEFLTSYLLGFLVSHKRLGTRY